MKTGEKRRKSEIAECKLKNSKKDVDNALAMW